MARGPTLAGFAVLAVLIAGGGFVANQIDAHRRLDRKVHVLTGGDPATGRDTLARLSCGGCHEIPGVHGAAGRVGPPLTHFAGRAFIGGRANNTPANLVRWIQDPHQFDPQSAMPPTGASDQQARDMAAYLYTLQ